MQHLEDIKAVFVPKHPPNKAQVGKLYELSFTANDFDPPDPEYYVFDTRGQTTGQTWKMRGSQTVLVLNQDPKFTTILVGEDILHVDDTEPFWIVELIPFSNPSN